VNTVKGRRRLAAASSMELRLALLLIHLYAALLHHLDQIPVADPVLAVPANAEQDDRDWKTTTLEHDPCYAGSSPIPVNATEPWQGRRDVNTSARISIFRPGHRGDQQDVGALCVKCWAGNDPLKLGHNNASVIKSTTSGAHAHASSSSPCHSVRQGSRHYCSSEVISSTAGVQTCGDLGTGETSIRPTCVSTYAANNTANCHSWPPFI
jgi:hypothetical protein